MECPIFTQGVIQVQVNIGNEGGLGWNRGRKGEKKEEGKGSLEFRQKESISLFKGLTSQFDSSRINDWGGLFISVI